MPVPTFHVTISGNAVTAYAAIVATCTAAVQLSNYLRDRPRIKLRVQRNMQLYGDPYYKGEILTLISVLNTGRRPVTISGLGAQRLFPYNPFVLTMTRPPLPYELTEGKSLIGILPGKEINLSTIDWWEASDAVGRMYRLKVAPWYSRSISNMRWFRRRRQEAKEKSKAAVNQ